MASNLLTALCLVFIIEGLAPFMAPALWRSAVQRIANTSDGQLRLFGLMAMLSGLLVLYATR